ncbi:ATP-binding protein [Dolichospermum sp. ST_con]|nr:ATP-binding protein [Dolichospermum sp. ST_con]MDD1418903.1 ATP-binding protein [Dolichospermum sp. ST_sed1]MDD1428043.1 ATP-binding protein [Dolichospermum sp. ST_sed9]MDD1434274.1 ATP-binding protein [Dolichospermum sp. ST_sed6]MDD1437670.1 ATP-binding protein [Dolichospermum sp. ST_sed10]MDD1443631.1 ATP-binding protein [Dolichospermum sp. ST_sed3]MDD1447599.1 ATP-binding protein [Dolichospermum sp. ST_sed8]MDD1454375.1 ATP-binding protein [Dolichospermum sp. ST_sed7]MDD1463262.1 ATP-
MKLIIKNLGPIKNNTKAIDLSKDFFVFVGQNNSGKSYVAQLLWAIFNEDIIHKFARTNVEIIDNKIVENINNIEVTSELLAVILNRYSSFLQEETKKEIFNIGKNSQILNNIVIRFEYEISELREQEIEGIVKIKDDEGNTLEYIEFKKDQGDLIYKFIGKQLPESIKEIIPKKSLDINLLNQKKFLLIATIIRTMLKHEHETFFLPASRIFFPTFYRYIYEVDRNRREQDINKLVDLLEKKGKIQSSDLLNVFNFKRKYTEPMNKVFEKLFSLNLEKNIEGHYINLVQELQEIIGGKIKLRSLEGIGLTEFYFKIDSVDEPLPMYLASSSVNQLTLLYLYLKYWASEKDNFLMIDEPEVNLHPENQIKLLNILIQFIQNETGNKVLITTHSSILANAINNFIYLDVLKNQHGVNVEKIIEDNQLKYVDSSISISKEKVGVYFFTGDKIIDYESSDYSIYFRNFREVENNLDKSLRILTDYIYRQEDEVEDE